MRLIVGGGMNDVEIEASSAISLNSESLALDRTSMRELGSDLAWLLLVCVSEKAVACRSRSMSSTLTGPLMDIAGGGCWFCWRGWECN